MQYTQQQRLAPEVPDESALYSPMMMTMMNTGARTPVLHLHIKLCGTYKITATN